MSVFFFFLPDLISRSVVHGLVFSRTHSCSGRVAAPPPGIVVPVPLLGTASLLLNQTADRSIKIPRAASESHFVGR